MFAFSVVCWYPDAAAAAATSAARRRGARAVDSRGCADARKNEPCARRGARPVPRRPCCCHGCPLEAAARRPANPNPAQPHLTAIPPAPRTIKRACACRHCDPPAAAQSTRADMAKPAGRSWGHIPFACARAQRLYNAHKCALRRRRHNTQSQSRYARPCSPKTQLST